MQTNFSNEQLADPEFRDAEKVLRKCVHCGFCLPTCPTYRLSGNELDSPRGRIYLIKNMLEDELTPTKKTVMHIDQCLSCLSCMTTCPSGVNYMHLIDQGRAYIEKHYKRPLPEVLYRKFIVNVLMSPGTLGVLVKIAKKLNFLGRIFPARYQALFELSRHSNITRYESLSGIYKSEIENIAGRVGLVPGCVQQASAQDINHSTIRVLNRLGYDVHILDGTSCCGAMEHHLGFTDTSKKRISNNSRYLADQFELNKLDAIITNISGCGTMIKDYAHILKNEAEYSKAADVVSKHTMDISEFLGNCSLGKLKIRDDFGKKVVYQNPCSMQHGQKIKEHPVELLRQFGYKVSEPRDQHLCCGSAGTYNLLHNTIASELGRQKAFNLSQTSPEIIASGNLGCITQLRRFTNIPVAHTVQLLDWASGGNPPFLAE